MNEISSVDREPALLDRIRYRPRGHDSAEGRIAAAIIEDPVRVCRESITEFACRCQVSVGSVVRFTRLMGCNGYRELKLALAVETSPARLRTPGYQPEAGTFAAHMRLQTRALAFALDEVDANSVEEAAALLARAGRIDVVATGDSGAIAQSLTFWLTSLGFHCRYLSDSAEQAAAAGFLSEGDVLIAISLSGRTRTVVEAATRAAANQAAVIALTCGPRSPLARSASMSIALDAQKAALGASEWPLRTALFAVTRALSLAVQQQMSEERAGQRRAVWASGRFGLRLT
jgi:DNA-binding MurR/RpiR family transcriptional regulator